VENIMKDIF